MIIPLAFTYMLKHDPAVFDVDAPLAAIIASPPAEHEVYVAVVDSETAEGMTIKLRAVVDAEVADPHDRVGTVKRFFGGFGGEVVDPLVRVNEVARLHGHLDYLRALRDQLNRMEL